MGGNGFTIAVQLLSLLLATQALTIEEVGRFLAISAASAIAFSLVGLGTGELLTAETARAPAQSGRYLNLSLLTTGASFVVLVMPVSWLEAALVDHGAVWVIVVFNLNFLLFSRLVSIAENLEIAFGRAANAAMARLIYAGLQLGAFGLLFVLPADQRLAGLAVTSAIAGALASAVAMIWLVAPHLSTRALPAIIAWRDSVQYLAGQLLATTTGNLDRVLAAAMLGETSAAIYVLASRAAQLAAMPVIIFFRTTYHRFFITAEMNDPVVEAAFLRGTLGQSATLALATAIVASAVFWLATRTVIADYADAAAPFAVICAALPATAVYYCFANQMNAHRQLLRRNFIDIAAVALLALAFLLVFGARSVIGLAFALLVAKVLTAVLAFVYRVRVHAT